MARARGKIRDAIVDYLSYRSGSDASVRSSLNLHVHSLFERTTMGRYRLRQKDSDNVAHVALSSGVVLGKAQLIHADCFTWLESQPENSLHACVTDPPYGVVEYTPKQVEKLRAGKGGVWRIPPSFDGHQRSPVPRFTTLSWSDRVALEAFFERLARLLRKVLVPGANVLVASNPLLAHLIAAALESGGLEPRGYIARLTMTMRGGDRPKNAHDEFDEVSVMPRSQWEPWIVMRKPLEGRVQDNLRKWKTGGFLRRSEAQPFGDVIKSAPTSKREREIAPHPSLKPQAFLREIVRASLPLREGKVLDPFAGSGSTLAAANYIGYESIGIESDAKFVRLAERAIPKLTAIVG
jgi:site-specific DNA-methyltransferase (adenine-specific)